MKRTKEQKEKHAAYMRKYIKHYYKRDYVKDQRRKYNREYMRRWKPTEESRKKTLERKNQRHRERKYGLKPGEFDALLEKQKGICALCGIPMGKDICVDHCHKTGKIRGLIHKKCNTMIGWHNDDIAMLEKAIEYLRKFN